MKLSLSNNVSDLISHHDIFKSSPGDAQTSAPSEKYYTNLNWGEGVVCASKFHYLTKNVNKSFLSFHK